VGNKIGVAVDTINNKFWSRNWTVTNGLSMTTTAAWEPATGNPQSGTGGYDISALPGNLFIWWGANGKFLDTVTLNAGHTAFYGLDGTGVIPSGFSAWDTTVATAWDAGAANSVALDAFLRDPFFVIPNATATLRVSVTGLTASVITTSSIFPSDDPYGTTWLVGLSYIKGPFGSIVMDGHSADFLCAFYTPSPDYLNGFLPRPVARSDWETVVTGAVSTTSKARV